METQIEGESSFAHIHVTLEPGESIWAESNAMASMDADLDMAATLNGGIFSAPARALFGRESLFINRFTNNTSRRRRLTLSQVAPGDIHEVSLRDQSIYLQPGAYIASTETVRYKVHWAGFRSLLAGEGLFKLKPTGQGTVWFGGFGAIEPREINGSFIVDTGHLIAYDPGIRLRIQFAGGFFSSLFGGEGLVTRLEGNGKAYIQTRSLGGLVNWLNPRLPD